MSILDCRVPGIRAKGPQGLEWVIWAGELAMRVKRYNSLAAARRLALLGMALSILAACGTVYRPGDETKSCAVLQSEIAANDAQIATNLAAVHAAEENGGLRPSGMLVGMSFALTRPQDPPQTKISSLSGRNGLLHRYASSKGC